jgi:hypothetical protein
MSGRERVWGSMGERGGRTFPEQSDIMYVIGVRATERGCGPSASFPPS